MSKRVNDKTKKDNEWNTDNNAKEDYDDTQINSSIRTPIVRRRFRVIRDDRSVSSRQLAVGSNNHFRGINNNNHTSTWNLFARLPPLVVHEIWDDAITSINNNNNTKLSSSAITTTLSSSDSGWSLNRSHSTVSSEANCSSGIEFLPLAITPVVNDDNVNGEGRNDGSTIYMSYNGGDCQVNSPTERVISIPDCFPIPSNTQVIVQVVPNVMDAIEILMEPLSYEDWEFITTDAEWIENGGFLQQVCIVYPNQIIPLRLQNGIDIAKVRVVPSNFERKSVHDDFVDATSSIWPDDDYDDVSDNENNNEVLETTTTNVDTISQYYPCLRLVANTQIIVIPKERENPTTNTTYSPMLRILPSLEDYSDTSIFDDVLFDAENKEKLRRPVSVPSHTILVHPKTISKMNFSVVGEQSTNKVVRIKHCYSLHDHRMADNDYAASTAIANLQISLEIPEGHVVLHTLLRVKLQSDLYMDYIQFCPVTQLELETLMTRTTTILNDPNNRLVLCPVKIVDDTSKPPVASWLMPNNTDRSIENHFYNLHQIGAEFLIQHDGRVVLHSVSFRPDTVCEIGCMISIAKWNKQESNSATAIYMLTFESNSMERYDESTIEGLVYFDDICNKLSKLFSKGRMPAKIRYIKVLPTQILPVHCLPSMKLLSSLYFPMFTNSVSSTSFLLYGEPGSGKTTVAVEFAMWQHLHRGSCIKYLNCCKLKASKGLRTKNLMDELIAVLDIAIKATPSVLVLDDLDVFINAKDDDALSNDMNTLQRNEQMLERSKLLADIFREFWQRMNVLNRDQSRIILIATSSSHESLKNFFTTTGGSEIIEIPSLTAQQNKEIIHRYFEKLMRHPVHLLPSLGSIVEGYRPKDLVDALRRVEVQICSIANPSMDVNKILANELQKYNSSASHAVRQTHLHFSWSEVGGLFRAKKILMGTFLQPSRYRRIYRCAKIRLPRGVLLFGPPGTGKSLIPAALAKECNYQLVTCRGPELLDKYIGASEAKVRDLFMQAKAVAPSLLFLDEIDSLAPKRGSDQTGVTDRIVNQLLTFLDGVEDTTDNKVVFIIAATSRPDKVDAALLRPGRLEKHIYIGYPESCEEWTDLIVRIAQHYDLQEDVMEHIQSGALYQTLSEESFLHRLSGADIVAVLNRARLRIVHKALEFNNVGTERLQIDYNSLSDAFSEAKPALADNDYTQLQSMYSMFRSTNTFNNKQTSEEKDLRMMFH